MHDVKITLADGGIYEQKVIEPGRSTRAIKGGAESHVLSVEFTDTHGERWVKRHGEGLKHAHSGKNKAE